MKKLQKNQIGRDVPEHIQQMGDVKPYIRSGKRKEKYITESDKVYTGSPLVRRFGEDHPTAFALIRNRCVNGRSSWDPSTALYAVEGECGVMRLSQWGRVSFRDDGVSDFTAGEGKCRYLSGTGDIAARIDRMFE